MNQPDTPQHPQQETTLVLLRVEDTDQASDLLADITENPTQPLHTPVLENPVHSRIVAAWQDTGHQPAIRITDDAVAAACKEAGWDWPTDPSGTVRSPQECMRSILQAAAPHLVDERVPAALSLHRADDDGTCMYCDDITLHGHSQLWPCTTARTLGARE